MYAFQVFFVNLLTEDTPRKAPGEADEQDPHGYCRGLTVCSPLRGNCPAGLMAVFMVCRCLPDPIHAIPHHSWDAVVLHGAGSGTVQPGRGSHSVEDLSFLQR